MYICPVCGYEKLADPPKDFNICPCCGTEFGLDDFDVPLQVLRHRWIADGCRWFSSPEGPPAQWNPIAQLNNLQYAQAARVSSSRTEQEVPRLVAVATA